MFSKNKGDYILLIDKILDSLSDGLKFEEIESLHSLKKEIQKSQRIDYLIINGTKAIRGLSDLVRLIDFFSDLIQ